MAPRAVCRMEDLTEGVPKLSVVGSRRIAVARWQGAIFAWRDSCPHQNVSFEMGRVRNALGGSDPRDMEIDRDRPVVTCPWHHFQFDLHSGRCISDSSFRFRTFTVTVEDDMVFVDE